jgi:hypothetical protein
VTDHERRRERLRDTVLAIVLDAPAAPAIRGLCLLTHRKTLADDPAWSPADLEELEDFGRHYLGLPARPGREGKGSV